MKMINFDRLLAESVASIPDERVLEGYTKRELNKLRVKDTSFEAILDLDTTKDEHLDLMRANLQRVSAVGGFMRQHIENLVKERELDIADAVSRGKLVSSVKISEGLKAYIKIFWVRGYTSRAIEEKLGVSDSTVSRYTRGLQVQKEGIKRGQIVELLQGWDEFDLEQYRRCVGTAKSYENTACNRAYTSSEIERIKKLTLEGKEVDEIAEIIGRKSILHIKQYMNQVA